MFVKTWVSYELELTLVFNCVEKLYEFTLLINSNCIKLFNPTNSIAALNRFNTWLFNGNPNDQPIKDFKLTFYCLGIKYGNKTGWNRLWQRFRNSSDKKEKGIILSALGCSTDNQTLKV